MINDMPRYRLKLAYDGAHFHGWQAQDNAVSVQESLETAIKKFCGETVRTIAAGRTDHGVHARGQIAHVDLKRDTDTNTLRNAINYHLHSRALVVLEASVEKPEHFHARFSATARCYRYRILNRPIRCPLREGKVWFVHRPLQVKDMQAAAQVLCGHHDFSAFRAAGCQASSAQRTLDTLDITREDDEIIIIAQARSFLYRQVRIMVGTLAQIGCGRMTLEELKNVLQSKDRRQSGLTAPAHGLCLEEVCYD